MNPHSAYIDKRIVDLKKSGKGMSKVVGGSHEDFIRDFSSCVFTNLIQSTFTGSYVKKHLCSEEGCGKPSKERAHGIGEERPILLARALKRVWPDTSNPIALQEVLVAFLEEHKTTKFTFKCSECHKKEGRPLKAGSTPC